MLFVLLKSTLQSNAFWILRVTNAFCYFVLYDAKTSCYYIEQFFFADVNTAVPDKKSIMMYVMCLFQSLPHSGDDVSGIDISAASNTTSPATTPSAEVDFN